MLRFLGVDEMIEIGGDVHFMRRALRQAQLAYAANEVPTGCVIVKEERMTSSRILEKSAARRDGAMTRSL